MDGIISAIITIFFNIVKAFVDDKYLLLILVVIALICGIICIRFSTNRVWKYVSVFAFAIALLGTFVLICAYFDGKEQPPVENTDSPINTESVSLPSVPDVYETPGGVDPNAQHFNLGYKFFENGNYEDAIDELRQVENHFSDYEEAVNLLNQATDLYIDEAITKAESFIAEENYTASIEALRAAEKFIGNSDQISVALKENENLYKDDLFGKAQVSFEGNDWEAAVALLKEGLYLLPDDEEIILEIEKYEAYAPIYIYDLTTFQGDDWELYASVEDNLGNIHYNAVGSSYFRDDTRVYKINKEYSKIKGTLFIRMDEKNSEWNTTLQIIGDDKLLYTGIIKGGEEPIEFEVDISGVDELTVFFDWMASASYIGGFAAIGEFALYRY